VHGMRARRASQAVTRTRTLTRWWTWIRRVRVRRSIWWRPLPWPCRSTWSARFWTCPLRTRPSYLRLRTALLPRSAPGEGRTPGRVPGAVRQVPRP